MIGVIIRIIVPLLIFVVLPAIYLRGVLRNMVSRKAQTGGAGTEETAAGFEGLVEMVKDEVCGKFIMANNSLSFVEGGNAHYFCSESCKEKYMQMRLSK